MREKYKDICVCQAKSIRDGFFCSFPLLTLIIFSNLGPNFVFWNVNFGFDHKLCIFAKKNKLETFEDALFESGKTSTHKTEKTHFQT